MTQNAQEDDKDDDGKDNSKSPSSIPGIARPPPSTSFPMIAAAPARLAAARRRPLTPFVLTTEIVEPGAPVSAQEEEALIAALCAYVEQGRGLRAVAVMGSLPTGVAPAYYARVRTVMCRMRGRMKACVPRPSPPALSDTNANIQTLYHRCCRASGRCLRPCPRSCSWTRWSAWTPFFHYEFL